MNILFVCRYNRFRSRTAEAVFKHYNHDVSVKVKSAGTNVDEEGYPILGVAGRVLEDLDIRYDHKQGAVHVTDKLISWADKIIVVADDAPITGFPKEKMVQLSIPDSYGSYEETKHTIEMIKKGLLSLGLLKAR